MADLESKVLEREIGKLGGFGARWSAKLLPNVAHETKFSLPSAEPIAAVVAASLATFGKPIAELPSAPSAGVFYVLVGSGHLDLNPTIVHVKVDGTSVAIRAVAKEGAIKQHSARLAVERFERAIRGSAA